MRGASKSGASAVDLSLRNPFLERLQLTCLCGRPERPCEATPPRADISQCGQSTDAMAPNDSCGDEKCLQNRVLIIVLFPAFGLEVRVSRLNIC